MKKLYLTNFLNILSIILCASLSAQVTIQESSIPIAGDSVTIAICSDTPEPGINGNNVTWDMSGLTETEEQYFVFKNPAETLLGNDFPNATISGISWQGNVSYYKVDELGLSTVGEASIINESDTFLLTYDDDESFIELPQMFNDMNSDIFSGISSTFGFEVPFNGNVSLEVDGEGTLILPNGTYSNVLRYHLEREFTTTFMGNTTTTTKEQWGWWSSDYRFWLLIMENNTQPVGSSSLVWYNKSPEPVIVLNNISENKQHLNMFPNPSHKFEPISFYVDFNDSDAFIQVFDLQGKEIVAKREIITKGINTFDLQLEAGIYILKIHTKENFSSIRLSIIE